MNTTQLTTIHLGGQLGRRFGKVHKYYIVSPAEAVRALCSQVEGFAEYLNDENRKTLYKVLVAEQQIDPEKELHELSGSKTVTFAPVIQGAKKGGLFQVVLGVVMVALAFTGVGAILVAGVALKGTLITMGVGMVLGGIAQMLSPQPRLDIVEPVNNRPNKTFNGVVNTVAAGNPVPIAYGEIICGSAVISAGIRASTISA